MTTVLKRAPCLLCDQCSATSLPQQRGGNTNTPVCLLKILAKTVQSQAFCHENEWQLHLAN